MRRRWRRNILDVLRTRPECDSRAGARAGAAVQLGPAAWRPCSAASIRRRSRDGPAGLSRASGCRVRLQPDGSTRIHLILRKSFRDTGTGDNDVAARDRTDRRPGRCSGCRSRRPLRSRCCRIATLTSSRRSSRPRSTACRSRSKVKLCGNEGQSDADWIDDAEGRGPTKAKANVQMHEGDARSDRRGD